MNQMGRPWPTSGSSREDESAWYCSEPSSRPAAAIAVECGPCQRHPFFFFGRVPRRQSTSTGPARLTDVPFPSSTTGASGTPRCSPPACPPPEKRNARPIVEGGAVDTRGEGESCGAAAIRKSDAISQLPTSRTCSKRGAGSALHCAKGQTPLPGSEGARFDCCEHTLLYKHDSQKRRTPPQACSMSSATASWRGVLPIGVLYC